VSDLMFSIVIACYKQQEFVRESVQSALSQAHESKEVIVVDDASPDGTAEVLRSFGDSIVLAISDKNRGACAARNLGASLAKGKYIVFLDGDDALMPWALETYSALINARHPAIILSRASVCYKSIPQAGIQSAPRAVRFVEYSHFLAKDRPWVYNTSALVVERAAFGVTDGWTPEIFYQDIQDLLNKMGVAGKAILLVEPETVWYRMHTTNATFKVAAFIDGIYVLLSRAKAGVYPGGRRYWFERSAWFGGLIFYWAKEAFRSHLYRQGFKLLIGRGGFVLLASIRRAAARLIGRKPVEVVLLSQALTGTEATTISSAHLMVHS
jgi:glycosyltransferase involved in cell wall biosynthesis